MSSSLESETEPDSSDWRAFATMKNTFSGETGSELFACRRPPGGLAQAVPNHSSYRVPANTTLRKIKARTKPGGRIVAMATPASSLHRMRGCKNTQIKASAAACWDSLETASPGRPPSAPASWFTRYCCQKSQIAVVGRPSPSAGPRGLLRFCACAPASSVRTA